MQAYDFEEDYRWIDPMTAEEFFETYDQIEFENSMESLDEMIEEGETTMIV